jgi:hypothetical protein
LSEVEDTFTLVFADTPCKENGMSKKTKRFRSGRLLIVHGNLLVVTTPEKNLE